MTANPMWLYYLILAISGILNLVGLVGLLLVFFPGLTVAWIGQLIWVIFVGFNKSHEGWQFGLTIGIFVFNTIIMLVGSFLDNLLMAGKARQQGAPWWEVVLSILGMIIGGIILTPIGGLLIALAIIFLLEYFRNDQDKQKAWESTKSMAIGAGTAAALRLLLCALMIGLWAVVMIWL